MIKDIKSPSVFGSKMKERIQEKVANIISDEDFKKSCMAEGMVDKDDMSDDDLDAEEQEDAINSAERIPDPGALDHDSGDHERVIPAGSRPADKHDIRDYEYADDDGEENVMPSDIDHKRGRMNEGGNFRAGSKSYAAAGKATANNIKAAGAARRDLAKKFKAGDTVKVSNAKNYGKSVKNNTASGTINRIDSDGWISVDSDQGKLYVHPRDMIKESVDDEAIYEDLKKDIQTSAKKGEVIELEFEDGDVMDIDPDTAEEILSKAKMSEFSRAGKSKSEFMKFLRKVLG